MADQGVWFKLHCSAVDDPDLDNLSLEDFGRWAKLGAIVKRHGTAGELTIQGPARALCAMFQVSDFGGLCAALNRLPNVDVRRDKNAVTGETFAVVSFHNWLRYQGDFSTPRVSKFRQMKRPRGEENKKRRFQKKREENTTPSATSPPESSLPPVAQFLAKYQETFQTHNGGEKPNLTGKDAGLAKQLIQRHGLDKVLEVLHRMFESSDPFIVSTGRTVGVLSSQWNKLVSATPGVAPKTQGNVDALRRFVRRGEETTP